MKRALMPFLVAHLLVNPGCGDDSTSGKRPAARTGGLPSRNIDRIVEVFNRGVGLMDQYRPAEAVAAFEEAVRLAPDWTTARLNLGIALLNAKGDESYARAEEELKRVISRDPENAYASYALGILFKHLARFDEAKERFERVLEIDPEDPDARFQIGALLADRDPRAARQHLEATLRKVPHHESACYRLQALLRKAGEKERASELLARFQTLKDAGAGVISGMRYGEMGRYAEVIRAFPDPAPAGPSPGAPPYADAAVEAGLDLASKGRAGWPGDLAGDAPSFGPGVAVADVNADGELDVYLPGAGEGGGGALYLSDGGRFSLAAETGIDGRDAAAAYFGDYDGDGDPDLYLTCYGPNRLYRNDGSGRFADVTEASGTAGGARLSLGASWGDADHDGDLDLYVANFSLSPGAAGAAGAPNPLWRNNGDGSFTDVAPAAGIDGGTAATVGVVFFDADDDRDLDLYLVNHRSSNRLFLNDRIGRYTEATSRYPELADDGPGLGAALGDVDLDGRRDLLLIRGREPPRLLLQKGRGRFVEDPAFAAAARDAGGAVGALLGDLDLDGDLDLALLGAGRGERTGHRILWNLGGGRFGPPVPLGEERGAPDARGAVAADLDGDGGLELIVARAGARPELWRAPRPAGRRWLEVIPSAGEGDPAERRKPGAIGLLIEVKTGMHLQVASVASSSGYLGGTPARAHFGLGDRGKADYVRLTWPDSVLQSELEVAADQRWRVPKVARKPSSCPLLFSWDGERFAFVTDFLGVGGLGFFTSPGEYAPPDPTESVRVPPELIAPRGGRYLLRIAEPLEEVAYLDELRLAAYDHPADWEVYPDERFASAPPLPSGEPLGVAEKIFPLAARTDRGEDVRERLLEIDRRYAEPPAEPRFTGYARDHWIELEFGEGLRGVSPECRVTLYLYGWVEYTYSHVNYAAHQAGLRMHPPRIELPDGEGGWSTAVEDAGFPAGLPRMMTLDISSLPLRREGRLRIRTSMEVFWDQIFIAEEAAGAKIRARELRPVAAELRPLGHPREYSPDGSDPTLYDYHRIDRGLPFRNLSGDFTRFGDVRELLEDADDRFVVMGRGEEVALEFEAAGLPALPEGWARTFVLRANGYCKDMDLYTAFPDTVGPLPFRGMANYPPAEPAPDGAARAEYLRAWNTRRVSAR